MSPRRPGFPRPPRRFEGSECSSPWQNDRRGNCGHEAHASPLPAGDRRDGGCLGACAGGRSVAPPIEIVELKFATFPGNRGNSAREISEGDTPTLGTAIGDEEDWGFGALGACLRLPGTLRVAVEGCGGFAEIDHNSFTGAVFEQGLRSLPSGKQQGPTWLLPTARVREILFSAVEPPHRGDAEAEDTLREDSVALTRS